MRARNTLTGGVLALLAGVAFAAAPATSDLAPLRSGAPRGLGPLTLHNLTHVPLGSARVFGGEQPDLFLTGFGGTRRVYVARWLRNTADGAPVFAPPQAVASPHTRPGAVWQEGDGTVRGGWIAGRELVLAVLDRGALAFQETRRVALPALPSAPGALAVLPEADGGLTVVFDTGDIPPVKMGDPWSDEWRPYDAAGSWRGPWPYRFLHAGTLPRDGGAWRDLQQATPTRREVYYAVYQLAAVNLGPGHERDLITGSRQGLLVYYRNRAARGIQLEPRRLAAGADGNALRNPSINAGAIAYAPQAGGPTDIITGGEGALSYYRFSGRFTTDDRPVFADPTPVLQDDADLYGGTLPVPSVVDWDGDGTTDIVAGNSEGRVLLLRNAGTDAAPAFLPGVALSAGGREIRIEAGYAGSVQGAPEAYWGYASPNVFDWDADGRPDIVMGDITGNVTVYRNRGRRDAPELEAPRAVHCDGFPLRGMWRVRPAVGVMGGRVALVTVDDQDRFHLYWRIDDFNVEDAGPLTLSDGAAITASGGPGGLTGRCKLDLFDWDGDGRLDFVIGTCRTNAIPNRTTGYPTPTLGSPRPPATVLFMRNVGTAERPVFEHATPFVHATKGPVQMGGLHESGAVGTTLGGGGPNLLATNEAGRFFLLRRANLSVAPRPVRSSNP